MVEGEGCVNVRQSKCFFFFPVTLSSNPSPPDEATSSRRNFSIHLSFHYLFIFFKPIGFYLTDSFVRENTDWFFERLYISLYFFCFVFFIEVEITLLLN